MMMTVMMMVMMMWRKLHVDYEISRFIVHAYKVISSVSVAVAIQFQIYVQLKQKAAAKNFSINFSGFSLLLFLEGGVIVTELCWF